VLNVSRYRSDAILVTSAGITSLPLPGLAAGTVSEQIISFHRALAAARDPKQQPAAKVTLGEILAWLWDAATGPVLEKLGYQTPPAAGEPWPRVWWVPGGPLGQLPLHAAGYHSDRSSGQPPRTVMDRVISSYSPTIRALRRTRQHAAADTGTPRRSLIVAMPVTPGHDKLPGVLAEVALVKALLPDPVLLSGHLTPGSAPATALAADAPTRANVLAQLPGCSIAHFACHGFSDPQDPSKSLLLLHDHASYPLTVASLAPVDLSHAQLAYLSACRTADTGINELIDEAINLATAFQLAGFPHVIGTLWQISDPVAVKVAAAFYARLRTSDGTLDTSKAASALHHTIRAQRDKHPDNPSLWAGYLHVGA
jgi:hypothetical protein